MSRRSVSKNVSKSAQQDEAYLQSALESPESEVTRSATAQWPKTLMKRYVVEQTMNRAAVLGIHFAFCLVQVVPTLVKEMLHTADGSRWRGAVRTVRQHHGWGMLALAVVMLFKMIYDRLFLMGFVKISLRTELFKLSIYLSLVFTYIVYPLMIILLGVSIGDWTVKAQDSKKETSAELVYLLVPILWAFALAVGGLNVWGEFASRNTCPSRSLLGTVRPRAELLSYTAWNLSLLLSAFVVFSNNARSKVGTVIELVMAVFVYAGSLNFLHSVVFWNQRLAGFYMSWSAVAFALKATSSLADFYLMFDDSVAVKDPFFLLAILVAPIFHKLGSTLTARLYRINVWDTTLNLTARYSGFLLMLDAVAAPHNYDSELQLFYRGVFESSPESADSLSKGISNQLKVNDPAGKKGVVNLFHAPDEKNMKTGEPSSNQAPLKEQKTEASSWYFRGFSKSRSKTMAKQDFRLAKSHDVGFEDHNKSPNAQFQTKGSRSSYDSPEGLPNQVCDLLIEYAKTSLDQSDERVWQLLLLLHMHRGFPSLVLLSRLLQRLESRALKRGISAQLEYYNFRKLYETKLDALYKGTVAEGEQPTMHSVWDIYCTMDTSDSDGRWDGGSRNSRRHRFAERADETELAKVLVPDKSAAAGNKPALVEPNWPFDQLKYYNMVVSKVLKLTDTRRALFSNLQNDQKTSAKFVYSCNEQTLSSHGQIKKDFQIFAANPAQFASYVYPMFIYYFSLIRNSPRLSKSILSAYKTKLLKVASQTGRRSKFDDVDWIQSSCVALQFSLDFKDLGTILGASLNYAEHLGEPQNDADLYDNWIVGRTLDSLLPSEFRQKHKQVVQKIQDLDQLRVHERAFFLMGFDDRLRSTQGVIKVLPCLSKRITAVSLLNFQYNPGSSLVLVEKDMSILHAEKRFWDALQDQPVESLEELSPEIRAAIKLYSFALGKHRASDPSAPWGSLPRIEQLFRGFGPGLLASEQGQALSAWCSQLYASMQEFWKFNEAKGLAFGIPTDSPYWGVFEDDQIVGGFEWNPQSSICSDVYKVYLRIVRVHSKQTDKKRQQTEVALGQQLPKPPASGLGLALLKQASNSMIEASPQVPTKQGENLIKEQALSSLGSISPRAPRAIGTPYPLSRVQGPWKLQAEDSLIKLGTAASKDREDLESPLHSERVQIDASRPGSAKAIPVVSSNPQEPAIPGLLPEGGSSDETEASQMKTDSRVSVWADGHLVDQTGSEINRGTSLRKLLADLFEVVVSVETTASTRLGLLETIGTEDSEKLMILQSDICQWLEVIKEIRSAISPDQFSAAQVAQFEQVNHPLGATDFKKSPSPQAANSGELQSVTTSRLEDPMIAHLKSATQLPGIATESVKPELPSRKRTDTSSKPKIKLLTTEKVHSAKTRFMDENKGMQTRTKRDQLIAKPDLPQDSGRNGEHRGNTNFIGNILNKVMVGKI